MEEIKTYLDVDSQTGKILGVHETFQELDERYFIRFTPPEGWDALKFTDYIWKDGSLQKLTKQESLDLYFDGIDYEAIRQKEQLIEKQKQELNKIYMDTLLKGLPDEQAADLFILYGEWKGGEKYVKGSRVQYGGLLYTCISDHVATQSDNPESAKTLWRVTKGNTQGKEYPLFQQGTAYTKNQIVRDEAGGVWMSNMDNNTQTPGMGTYWTRMN